MTFHDGNLNVHISIIELYKIAGTAMPRFLLQVNLTFANASSQNANLSMVESSSSWSSILSRSSESLNTAKEGNLPHLVSLSEDGLHLFFKCWRWSPIMSPSGIQF